MSKLMTSLVLIYSVLWTCLFVQIQSDNIPTKIVHQQQEIMQWIGFKTNTLNDEDHKIKFAAILTGENTPPQIQILGQLNKTISRVANINFLSRLRFELISLPPPFVHS